MATAPKETPAAATGNPAQQVAQLVTTAAALVAPAPTQDPAIDPNYVEPETTDTIATVFGDMVDSSTGITYTTQGSRYKEYTPWMRSQVAHGKMKFI